MRMVQRSKCKSKQVRNSWQGGIVVVAVVVSGGGGVRAQGRVCGSVYGVSQHHTLP
jgi:hypothetical protein